MRLHALATVLTTLVFVPRVDAAELARSPALAVVDIALTGPAVSGKDRPTETIFVGVTFQHESGAPSFTVAGFWDGGDVWRVRFNPTKPGRWAVADFEANRAFSGIAKGDHVTATPATTPGFWLMGKTAGGRWFQRSDGSHRYIVGNTHYDFLFAPLGKEASRQTIEADVQANAPFFNKLRFCLMSPRRENEGSARPFLDGDAPTGVETAQPNPAFFRERVDVAVNQALALDIIADLILGGTVGDQVASESGFLRYVAARYGAYPNVWFTIGQEWNEQTSASEQKRVGTLMRGILPYPTPMSTHATGAWTPDLNGAWASHSIRQLKSERLDQAATAIEKDYANNQQRPAINDENGYDPGEASTDDVIEGITGSFAGGGYGTTGHKAASKEGGYFWGHAAVGKTIDEHPSRLSLGFLRKTIDEKTRFHALTPSRLSETPFRDAPSLWRALAWPGQQYVLASNSAASFSFDLPAGSFRLEQFDIVRRTSRTLAATASGRVELSTPASRAALTVVTRIGGEADRPAEQAPVDTPAPSPPPSEDPDPENAPPQSDSLPRITSTSEDLDVARVGRPYAEDLEADGGEAPLTFTARGLPAGITVASGGSLEGTPTEPGEFEIEVTVTDADGDAASAVLQLLVEEGDDPGAEGGAGGGAPQRGEGEEPKESRAGGCAAGGAGASGALWWLLALVMWNRARRPGRAVLLGTWLLAANVGATWAAPCENVDDKRGRDPASASLFGVGDSNSGRWMEPLMKVLGRDFPYSGAAGRAIGSPHRESLLNDAAAVLGDRRKAIDELLISLGTNDCQAKVADAWGQIPDYLRGAVRAVRAYGFAGGLPHIVVATPAPIAADENQSQNFQDDGKWRDGKSCAQMLVMAYRRVAVELDLGYVNVHDALADDWDERYTGDGVHYAGEGGPIAARQWAAVLEDRTAPRPPRGVVQTATTLTWSPSPDADVVGYQIWQGDRCIGAVVGTTFDVAGVTAPLTVRARDGYGNHSVKVAAGEKTESPPFDTAPDEDAGAGEDLAVGAGGAEPSHDDGVAMGGQGDEPVAGAGGGGEAGSEARPRETRTPTPSAGCAVARARPGLISVLAIAVLVAMVWRRSHRRRSHHGVST